MKIFKQIYNLIFIIIAFFCSSCIKITIPPIINNQTNVWEIWKQQQPYGIAFFEGSQNDYQFKDDSFRTKIQHWTDAISVISYIDSLGVEHTISDSCGSRKDYIYGTFITRNDSMIFSGKMCNNLFSNAQPNSCLGTTDYYKSYKCIRNNDSTLTLNPDGHLYYGDIVLKKK